MELPAVPSTAVTEVPEDAKCLACGYSLVQLTSLRCPECGKPFDPARPESYDSASWRASLVRGMHRRRLEQRAAEPSREYRQIASVSLGVGLIGLLSVPWLLGLVCLGNWLVLAGLALRELSRWHARRVLAWPVLARPVLGRYGWKLWTLALMAVVPIPMSIALLLHLPLFSRQAREINEGSFHAHPSNRFVGVIWVQIDRCPHAIYFIAPQNGNPFSGGVTLVRRTSTGSCKHVYGLPVWKDWTVRVGKGRGRDPPYG